MSRIFLWLLVMGIFYAAPSQATQYSVFDQNGKQGLKNEENQVVIPAEYDEIGWTEGKARVHQNVIGYRSEDRWGLITTDNERVTPTIYSSVSTKDSGFFIKASKTANSITRVGLVNAEGEEVLPFLYANIQVYREKFIVSKFNNNNLPSYGLLNAKGKVIIPIDFQEIKPLGSLRFIARKGNEPYHLFNDEGIQMARFEADSIAEFDNGYAKFWKQHLAGLVNTEGKVVVEAGFRNLTIDGEQVEAEEYPVWKSISTQNQMIDSWKYDHIIRVNDSVNHVQAQGKHWLIDNGENTLSAQGYDYIGPFDEGFAIFRWGKKYGVLRQDGKVILRPDFITLIREHGFYYGSNVYHKWFIYDQFGVRKNPVTYDSIGDYQKLHFKVKKGDFWGMMKRTGEENLFCVYDSLGDIQDQRLVVKFKGLYGIVDLEGKWLVTPGGAKKELINDELYFLKIGSQTRIYSYSGKLIYFTDNKIEAKAGYFLEYLTNGKVWRISFSGVIEADKISNIVYRDQFNFSEFEEIHEPSEGYYGIRKDGKYGFIDDLNRLRIANRYDSVQQYHEGRAAVKLLSRWGFIDKEEVFLIQPKFEEVGYFRDGICRVKYNGMYNLIDTSGQLLFNKGFEDMVILTPNMFKVKSKGKYGLVNRQGKVLVNYIFDELTLLDNKLVIVEKLGKMGVVGLDGLYIIPRNYVSIHFDDVRNQFLAKEDVRPHPVSVLPR